MPGAPRKFSDKQRQAVIRRINEDGLSVGAAVEEAKAGTLEEGLAPFSPSPASAERWASEAARYEDPAAHLPDPAAVESAALRLWELHLASLDELEALKDKDKDKRSEKEQRALDQGTLAAIKRQRELRHLLIRTPASDQDDQDEPRLPATETESPLLQRLAHCHAESAVDSSGHEDEHEKAHGAASRATTHAPTLGSAGARARQEVGHRSNGATVLV